MPWLSFWPWRSQYKFLFLLAFLLAFLLDFYQYFFVNLRFSHQTNFQSCQLHWSVDIFFDFNILRYFCTFAQLNKTVNGTILPDCSCVTSGKFLTFLARMLTRDQGEQHHLVLDQFHGWDETWWGSFYIAKRIHIFPSWCTARLPHIVTDATSLRQKRLVCH